MTLPSNDYYDEAELAPDPFDPEAAKQLLADIGYPDGLKTKVYASQQAGTDVPALARAIAGYWKDIGVDAEIVPIEHTKIGEWHNSGLPTPKELMGTVSFSVMTSPLTTVAFNLVHDSTASVHQSRFPDLDAAIAKCQEAMSPRRSTRSAATRPGMSHDTYLRRGCSIRTRLLPSATRSRTASRCRAPAERVRFMRRRHPRSQRARAQLQ